MESIKSVEARIKRLKVRLSKKTIVENFGDKEQRDLETFISDIYEYPYGDRLIIQDRIQSFWNWCADYTR